MSTYTAIFEQDGDWWIGYVEELPGANTQGRTLEEARENLKDAIQLLLEVRRNEIQQDISGKDIVREVLEVAI